MRLAACVECGRLNSHRWSRLLANEASRVASLTTEAKFALWSLQILGSLWASCVCGPVLFICLIRASVSSCILYVKQGCTCFRETCGAFFQVAVSEM